MREAISLGLDLGTSALKAVLLDSQGTVLGQAEVALAISRPRPGWSEQEPAQWWEAVRMASLSLRTEYPSAWSRVVCIGLSGQMHGAVLLDRDDLSIRPAILHNDGRADHESRLLASTVPGVEAITGSRPMPGFTAPKILWMARHEPARLEAVDCVVSPKDYLGLRLTGRRATDVSDAAGTLWLDVKRRVWSPLLVQACGLSMDQLPSVLESGQPRGTLLPGAAADLKLSDKVVVAAGAGDTPASGVGIGATEIGNAFVNLSTSASVVAVVEQPLLDLNASIHAMCHAVPHRYYQMGAMLSGASCLRWITGATGVADEARMLGMIEQRMATPLERMRHMIEAPIFLPYLSGERTPHNNVDASGVFFGMNHGSDATQLGYAVMEGVCFGLRDGLASIASTGTQMETLAIVGGGARSVYWAELLASALHRPVQRVAGGNLSAAIGAARLGWVAWGKPFEEVNLPAAALSHHAPDKNLSHILDGRYSQFRELYAALSTMFSRRARSLSQSEPWEDAEATYTAL